MKLVESAPDILAAATALGGLTLVFLGNTATSYDSYGNSADQSDVRPVYRRRAWFAFSVFYACLFSALTALGAEIFEMAWAAAIAGGLLVVALALIAALGMLTVGDID
ncbi:hypothetical protein [Sphingomonas oryzagri]|uniref:Uncharacterized protein n=1 Tax=Sphingomonas oryzagri TaxID=3042314 RepID=A0ABT6N5C7_9SPHN|nr:hypothetical protein [Sphingomonas oryzagri]MDH7640308.1 hypothetical protein [Sphingomonas oryzagri]